MKIREVRIRNFRNFGANARPVSFVDPLTQQARPLSVLVGSNGCGKTTVLEVIEGLLRAAADWGDADICGEVFDRRGNAEVLVEMSTDGFRLAPPDEVTSVRAKQAPRQRPSEAEVVEERRSALFRSRYWTDFVERSNWPEDLESQLQASDKGEVPLRGGLLYFPHRRWVEYTEKGSIKEPSQEKRWLFHFEAGRGWSDSLSQLWVWQNYLDLEQGREGRPNLMPFVAEIEAILGRGRKVVIRGGRVYIEQLGRDSVQPHQLPSGEQQVLTLFGEIIRQVRPGGVLMIDEVEISLHPALQRVVLHHLRELARRHDLQVILTTHSMDIVAAVAPEELVNLDEMVLEERAQAGVAE